MKTNLQFPHLPRPSRSTLGGNAANTTCVATRSRNRATTASMGPTIDLHNEGARAAQRWPPRDVPDSPLTHFRGPLQGPSQEGTPVTLKCAPTSRGAESIEVQHRTNVTLVQWAPHGTTGTRVASNGRTLHTLRLRYASERTPRGGSAIGCMRLAGRVPTKRPPEGGPLGGAQALRLNVVWRSWPPDS